MSSEFLGGIYMFSRLASCAKSTILRPLRHILHLQQNTTTLFLTTQHASTMPLRCADSSKLAHSNYLILIEIALCIMVGSGFAQIVKMHITIQILPHQHQIFSTTPYLFIYILHLYLNTLANMYLIIDPPCNSTAS